MPISLILTEGEADDVFVRELIRTRSLADLEVVSAGKAESYGWTGFQKRLEGLKLRRGLQSNRAIVIITDSDDRPEQRFAEIVAQIRAAGGYGIPANPCSLSTATQYPPISILLVPWGNQAGCLDSLCGSSVISVE